MSKFKSALLAGAIALSGLAMPSYASDSSTAEFSANKTADKIADKTADAASAEKSRSG